MELVVVLFYVSEYNASIKHLNKKPSFHGHVRKTSRGRRVPEVYGTYPLKVGFTPSLLNADAFLLSLDLFEAV